MYVCLCRAVSHTRVRELGQAGVTSPEALIKALGLDRAECCGYCRNHIDGIVAIAQGSHPLEHARSVFAAARQRADRP